MFFRNNQHRWPNNRLDLTLKWFPSPIPDLEHFLEEDGPANCQGTLRIYDGSTLLKDTNVVSYQVPTSTFSSPKVLQVEAVLSGITDLKFAAKTQAGIVICEDVIRITGIPEVPQDGRIVFVDSTASGGSPPFDDISSNAASTIGETLVNLEPQDNIVVVPGTYSEWNLDITKSCVISGLCGRHDDTIDTSQFNLTNAPVVNASFNGRVFMILTTMASDEVVITGITLKNGIEATGGGIYFDDSAEGSLTLSFGAISDCEATSTFDATYDWADFPEDGGGGIVTVATTSTSTSSISSLSSTSTVSALSSTSVAGGGGLMRITGRGDKIHKFRRHSFQNGRTLSDVGGGIALRGAYDPAKIRDNSTSIRNALQNGQNLPLLVNFRAVFSRCLFENNSALKGGAIAATTTDFGDIIDKPKKRMCGGMPFIAERCIFRNNNATGGDRPRGGAIWMWGGNTSGSALRGCTLENNSATGTTSGQGDGGAIAVMFMAGLNVTAFQSVPTLITNNSGTDGEGGIYVTYFGLLRLEDSNIVRAHSKRAFRV